MTETTFDNTVTQPNNALEYRAYNCPIVGGQAYQETFDCGDIPQSAYPGAIYLFNLVIDASNLTENDIMNGVQIAWTSPEGQPESEDITNSALNTTGGQEIHFMTFSLGIHCATDLTITLEYTAQGGVNPPPDSGTFNIHLAVSLLMTH